MKYLILPILLTILCFSGFTSQVQAPNGHALMSLEHDGTAYVMGSRDFIVPVCNEFEVELWIRELPFIMFQLFVYITWDPDLMELQNVELNLPASWFVANGPTEEMDSCYIYLQGSVFSSNWKWITFTFHCKGEGSSPINIPEHYEPPTGGMVGVGPAYIADGDIDTTLLKAAVNQFDATVGGLTTPTNKLDIITPYMALAGLIAAVSTVYVIKKRKD